MTRIEAKKYYEWAMWAILAALITFGLAAAVGCSGADATTVQDDPSIPAEPKPEPWVMQENDEQETDPVLAAGLAREMAAQIAREGEPEPFDYDQVFDIDAMGVDDVAPNSDKIQMPLVYGWSVQGTNVTQATVVPTAHCVTFNRACDGAVHSQANDINYTSVADFADDLRGRCGRFDSTVDNSWKPCILPQAQRGTGSGGTGKRWWYYVDTASCPNDASRMSIFKAALSTAGGRWMGGDDTVQLVETTVRGNAKIVVGCNTTDIPAGKIAIGAPQGPLVFRFAPAAFGANDKCEDGNPLHAALHAYVFPDMTYTYSAGYMGVRWSDFWTFVEGCGGSTANKTERASSIVQHEFGHIMGFPHAQLPDLNVMNSARTCSWALNSGQGGFATFYRTALNDLDSVSTLATLNYYDEDISCYSPLGGSETPSD